MKLLLDHGGIATLKDINKRGLTALGEAVLGGHTAIANELIKVSCWVSLSSLSALESELQLSACMDAKAILRHMS